MNEDSTPTPDTTLTSEDRRLIADIAKEATKPGWESLLTMAAYLLMFVGSGAIVYSVPFLMKARALRVCERHGSQWFPLAPTPDHYILDRLLWTTGVLLILAGLAAAAWNRVQIRRTRRLHELLSRAYPE